MKSLHIFFIFLLTTFLFTDSSIILQLKDTTGYVSRTNIQDTVKLPSEIQNLQTLFGSFKTHKDLGNFHRDTSMTKLKHYAKMLYVADEIDAVNNRRMMEREERKSDSIGALNKKFHENLPNIRSPFVTRGEIERKTYKGLSHCIYALITTQYLLKAKIFSISSSKLPVGSSDPGLYVHEIDIKALVEEAIKGKNRFTKGDTVTYYFIPQWRSLSSTYFRVGGTYFLPLRITESYPDTNNLCLALATLDREPTKNASPKTDLSKGCFPIENGYLIDENNYFGYGVKIPWNVFRDKINKQIDLIKLW